MNYKQLTVADRKAIEILLKLDFNKAEIGKQLGVDKSTICREVKKRSTPNGYLAWSAQVDYEKRRKKCGRKPKLSSSHTQGYVLKRIKKGWSPQQVSGRMRLENRSDYVCPETIYSFIYENEHCQREKIYQYLRWGRKKRRKKGGRRVHRSPIPNRVSIHCRPKIVDQRTEFGHWEGDSVIYPHLRAINTLNELQSGLVIFTKLRRKTADRTARAMSTALIGQYSSKTLTLDNGSEFVRHEQVSKDIGVKIYFCDPYSSWQRGSNENTNMLLRGYLPKRHNINHLTQEELNNIADELNRRPRKRLGYLSPLEFYHQKVNNLKKGVIVALRSRM